MNPNRSRTQRRRYARSLLFQDLAAPPMPKKPKATEPPAPGEPMPDDSGMPMETADETSLAESAVIVVCEEEVETADRRIVSAGGLDWRDPPLTLTINHDPDQRAGMISAFGRCQSIDGLTVDTFDAHVGTSGNYVVGLVAFDLSRNPDDGTFLNMAAVQAASQVVSGVLMGVSMEVGNEQIEWECIEVDDDGFCVDERMRLLSGTIGAVTLAPFQAIDTARVVDVVTASGNRLELPGLGEPCPPPPVTISSTLEALIASGGPPAVPPAEWFDDPEFEAPTAMTITDEGRIFGHLALWGTCHTSMPGCEPPPRNRSGYAMFHLGETITSAGPISTGLVTFGMGHAPLRDGLRVVPAFEALAHYDNTDKQAADIRVGEDDHGIWFAGALRPTLTDDQVRALRSAKLSGDWRSVQGRLEMLAALAVNVPGFIVPRTQAVTAAGPAGEPVRLALVASASPSHAAVGCGCASAKTDNDVRLDRLETIVAALGLDAQAADAITASLAL